MGKNGAGKSTLLKMIAGALTPDAGEVKLGASLKMGYFAQQSLDVLDPDLTIEEQLREGLSRTSRSARCAASPARSSSPATTSTRRSARCRAARRRAWCMARMLLNPPNFLVLDEPTNHLDLATKEMLLDSLKDFEGTMLFVSHDRAFLRGLSNRVLELGGESGTDAQPHAYPGSYVEYVERTGHEAPGVHA